MPSEIIPIDLSSGLLPEHSNNVPSVAKPDVYNPTNILSQIANQYASKSTPNTPIATPEPLTRRYDIYNPLVNNEEIYAQNQSALSQIGNSIVKGLATAGSTFAEGLTSLYDTGKSLTGENIYKNEWAQDLDNWRANLEDKFPNYYSKWQMDHPFLSAIPFSGGAANFWGDKVIKNIGFTVGAIGSAAVQDLAVGAITEGIGEIPLLSSQIGKASLWLNKLFTGTNDLEKVLSTADALQKSERTILTLKNMAQLSATQKVTNGARYVATLWGAANTEAAIEARDGYNKVKEDLIQTYRNENGKDPQGDDLNKIDQYATAAGNSRYAINMALLIPSNIIQFNTIFKPFTALKNSLKTGLEASIAEQEGTIALKTALPSTASDLDNLIVKNGTKSIFNKFIKPAIPNILSEGVYEEGGQFAAEKGVQKYFEDKYNKKIKGNLDDKLNAIGYGLSQEFGSTEGLENILLGGLTGTLLGPVEGIVENTRNKRAGVSTPEQATQIALGKLKDFSITGLFQDNYDNTANSIKRSQDIQQAVESNNIFKFKNLKSKEFFDFITSGIKANRFDVRIEQLNLLKELPSDEFNKLFGIQESERPDTISYLDNLIVKANQIKSSHDTISNIFRNPYRYRGNATNEENEKYLAFEDYKSALTEFSYNTQDFNSRLNDIQGEIGKINPLINNTLLSNLTSKESLNNLQLEYTEQANNLQKQIDDKLLVGDSKINARESIKKFNTLSKQIKDFINSKDFNPTEYLKIFPEILNFELNGRQDGNISVPREKASDLITFGHDINRINNGKIYSSQGYDYLFSQEGFDDFMKNYAEWKNALSAEPKEEEIINPEDNPLTFGELSFRKNRLYKETKDRKYKVSDKENGFELVSPTGKVVDTFKNREDAEKQRDYENENLKKLQQVKIIDKTETGLLQVEDQEGKIQNIDPELLFSYESVQSPEELEAERLDKLKKNKKTFTKYTKQNNIIEANSGVPVENGDVSIEEFESYKKDISIIRNTGTEQRYEDVGDNPYNNPHKRHQEFLLNFSRNKKMQDIRDNVFIIPITNKTQNQLGLTGIIDPKFADSSIRYVYVLKDDNSISYIGKDGQILNEIGQPTNLQELVFTNVPEEDLSYISNGERIDSWTNKYDLTDEQIQELKDEWVNQRNLILNANITTENAIDNLLQFDISRGIPNIINTSAKNNVLDLKLVNNDDLFQPLITIPTIGNTVIAGSEGVVNMPIGKPVFNYNGNLFFLNNRNLTESEVNNITDLLVFASKEIEKTGEIDPKIYQYLNGIIRYSKTPTRNSFGFDSNYNLHIGNKLVIPITKVENSIDQIKDSLKEIYHHVNLSYLNEFKKNPNNTPFEEVSLENGQLKTKNWDSYQHYLLQKRGNSIAPLTTNLIVPQDGELPIVQKYPIIKYENLSTPTIVTSKKVKNAQPKELKPQENNLIAAILNKKKSSIKAEPKEKSNLAANILAKKQLGKKAAVQEESQIQPINKASEILKKKGFKKSDGTSYNFDGAAKRTIIKPITLSGNKSIEESEVKRMLPGVEISHLENIITTTGNMKAWGAALPHFIYIWEQAPYGVLYHEAFEQVFNFVLDPNSQLDLVVEFNKREGSFTTFEGVLKPYSLATFEEAKEQIADEFAEYKTTGTVPYSTPKISNFFTKLWNLLKSLFTNTPETIANVFEKLNKGEYANSPIMTPIVVEAQFKRAVEDTPESLVQDTIAGMTAEIFMKKWNDDSALINELEENPEESTRTLFSQLYDGLEKYFTSEDDNTLFAYFGQRVELNPELEEEYLDLYEQIKGNWENVKAQWPNYVQDLKSFLKLFDVAFTIDDNGDVALKEDLTIDENDKLGGSDGYGSEDKLFINAKNSASKVVKLLFATIADSEFVYNTTKKELGNITKKYVGNYISRDNNQMRLPNLASYAKLFNYTLHNSANTNGFRNIYDKLRKQSLKRSIKINANLEVLLNRLGYKGSFSDLSKDKVKIILKLENALSKQKPEFFNQYVQRDGTIVNLSSSLSDRTQQVLDSWITEIASSKFVTVDKNKIKFKKDVLNKDKFALLQNLGINFNPFNYNQLPKKAKEQFNEQVEAIKEGISQYTEAFLPLITTKQSIGFGTRLEKLAEIYTQYIEGDTTESQHYNIDDKPTSNFILNNYVSYILNDTKDVNTIYEFKAVNPQYNDLYMGSSYILNNILFKDGKRTNNDINVSIVEGRKAASGDNNSTAKMTYGERLLYEVNNNLNSVYYTLLPADAKTEWGLRIPNIMNKSFFKGQKNEQIDNFVNEMWNVLNNEIELAKDFNNRNFIQSLNQKEGDRTVGNSLRFFKGILSTGLINKINSIIDNNEKLNKDYIDDFKEDLINFVNQRAEKTIFNLKSYGLIDQRNNTSTVYGIDKNFLNSTIGNKKSYVLTNEALNNLFFYREANYIFNNIEMHKFLFNDPAQYKDELKRVKSFLSGREYTHSDPQSDLNSFLDKTLNEGLKVTDWGYKHHSNTFNSITINDVTTESEFVNEYVKALGKEKASKYYNNDVADAQSWALGIAHREMMYKSGARYSSEQDKLHNWLMAYERQKLLEKGIISEDNYSTDLQTKDKQLLKTSIPQTQLQILKPIISGVRLENNAAVQYLYKTSTAPLYLYFVENTPMEEIYINMMKKGIDLLALKSAHKVGITNNNITNLYNEGKLTDFTNISPIGIDYKYFGIQVETGGTKDYQTQGSQLTKLAVQNLMSNGIPNDYLEANKGLSEEDIIAKWNNLNEEEKRHSEGYKLVKRHNQLLTELTLNRAEKLFDKLNIQKGEFGYSIEDKTKVADFILNELTRRELPTNLGEGIQTIDGQFVNPIEANVNYNKIKQILWSVIENNITKPKVSGGPKILLSALGFDNIEQKEVNGKLVNVSSKYKFYTQKDGKTQACQIALPFIFGDKILKRIQKENNLEFKTNKEGYKYVLDYLNNTKEGKRLLQGIGFRIPTQGLNSIDYFEIVEFLPPQMGDCVIFPAEITTKAGSDFDVDKMNMYIKNWYINDKGLPQVIPFYGIGEKAIEKFEELALSITLAKKVNADEEAIDKIDSLEGDEFKVTAKELYMQSLENEYYAAIQDILAASQSFEKLITPNDASQLENISAEIVKLKSKNEKQYDNSDATKLIDSEFMSKKRQTFQSMKYGVGIAAVANTNLAINQLGNVLISIPEKLAKRNFQVRFKHNSLYGKINLSATKNKFGDYLSDLNSQVIDGTVDVAKKEWLPEMIGKDTLLNVLLFMYKAGIDPTEAAYFLNQPSIQEYLRQRDIIENMGSIKKKIKNDAWWVTRDKINRQLGVMNANKVYQQKPDMYNKTQLRNFIGLSFNDLSKEDKVLQVQILDDFIGYQTLAWDLFRLIQGYNWDTTRYTSPEAVDRKKLLYQKALKSPNTTGLNNIMNDTFIGTIKNEILNINEGLSSTINTLQGDSKRILNQMAVKLQTQRFNQDNFVKYLQKSEASLLDYIIQTQSLFKNIPLNKYNSALFINEDNIADWVKEMKNSPFIQNNPILQNIEVITDKKEGYNSYLRLVEKDYDTYTSNVWTAAFRELRDSGLTISLGEKKAQVSDLFNYIMVSQILQNGISRNKNSFLHLIPNEDFAKLVTPVLTNINGNLDYWLNEGLFYRNNYNDNFLVPEVPAEMPIVQEDDSITYRVNRSLKGNQKFQELLKEAGYENTDFLTVDYFNNRNKPFMKITDLKTDKNGAIIEKNIRLYKRVDLQNNEGQFVPAVIKNRVEDSDGVATTKKLIIYKEVNKLGNDNLKEYYSDKVQSILVENPFIKEPTDQLVISALEEAKKPVSYGELTDLVSDDEFDEADYFTDEEPKSEENILSLPDLNIDPNQKSACE